MAVSSRELPLGVAILAVLIGLFGAFLLLIGILVLLAVGLGVAASAAAFGVSFLGGALLAIVGAVFLAVAKGLWDQELWALVISVIAIGFLLLGVVLSGALLSLEGLVLGVLLIYLILVNRHFR